MKKNEFTLPEGAFGPLDEEEAEIMAAIEAGTLRRSKTAAAEISLLEAGAKNAAMRKKPVTIRLDPEDVDGMKKIAKENGTRYQTLISSIIRQYRTGRLVSR